MACALALGCAGDDSDVNDGATSRADDDDTSATATHDDTIAGSSGVTRASVSDSDTSADDSITDSDPSDASSSNGGTDTVADSTTGEELYCGLEDLAGGPWFELGHAGVPLAEGSVLTLECGGQGSLMFFLETRVGGWMPDDDRVYYSVTVDVEGHVGPSGHFFQDTMFGEYIGCEKYDGGTGPLEGIAVIPPDDITDPTVLHGLSATIHVELLAEGSPTFDATVELAVPDEPSIGECGAFG